MNLVFVPGHISNTLEAKLPELDRYWGRGRYYCLKVGSMCSPVQVRVQGESEDAGVLLGEGSMCTVHEGEGARLPSAVFFCKRRVCLTSSQMGL